MGFEGQDRRRFKRVPFRVPATIHVKGEDERIISYDAEVLDLSEGGMRIQTTMPVVAVGQEVVIQVRLAEGLLVRAKITDADAVETELSEENLGESIIRWAKGPEGTYGVEFQGLKPEKRVALRKLVQGLLGADDTVTNR